MVAEQKRMHDLLSEIKEDLPTEIARKVREDIETFSQEQGNIMLSAFQSFQSILLEKMDDRLNGLGSSSAATGAGGVVTVTPKNSQQISWQTGVSIDSPKILFCHEQSLNQRLKCGGLAQLLQTLGSQLCALLSVLISRI